MTLAIDQTTQLRVYFDHTQELWAGAITLPGTGLTERYLMTGLGGERPIADACQELVRILGLPCAESGWMVYKTADGRGLATWSVRP